MASRNSLIKKEELLNSTNGGKDVFEKEIGEIKNVSIKSPLRNDNNPSFKVFRGNGGIWFYKDFSTGDSGDCFTFLMNKYNISYIDALKKVKNGYTITKSNIDYNDQESIQKETIIEFSDKPFTKEAHKYWNSYCLEEDFLRKDDIFQVKSFAINGKLMKIPKNQTIFAFYASDIDKVKLLTIGENVRRKWISNIKNSYLWFYNDYEGQEIEDLFVIKSVKDRMVLKLLDYKGVALQNESATTFLKSNINKIEKICKRPIILMGADTQGFETSLAITKATGYRWFNSPKYMLRFGINDPSGVCQEFGIDILQKQIKRDLKKWK